MMRQQLKAILLAFLALTAVFVAGYLLISILPSYRDQIANVMFMIGWVTFGVVIAHNGGHPSIIISATSILAARGYCPEDNMMQNSINILRMGLLPVIGMGLHRLFWRATAEMTE